jgi:type IV pilus assembly protein PilM
MNPGLSWGCEISPSSVCLARWGEAQRMESVAVKPLEEGAVEVSPLHENVQRPDEVRQALAACLASQGHTVPLASGRGRDTALIVPDQAARVFFLDFDSLPQHASEAIPLVRWRLKKSVPFDIEDSTVAYFARRREAQWAVVAVVSPHAIIRQYESLAESAGLKPRLLTLSTLATLGLLPAPAGDAGPGSPSVLVAKYSPPAFTTAIVHDGSLCLFRSVSIGRATGEVSMTELREAIYPAVAYFQDNYGGTLETAYLCGLGESTAAIAESLAQELHLASVPLLAESALPRSGWDGAQLDRNLAAVAGLFRQRRRE